MWEKELREAASILGQSTQAVASCGAGVSAESVIPTFRDAGGIWDRINPVEVGTPDGLVRTLEREAHRLVPLFAEMLDSFLNAEPNPGHRALADLEAMGILKAVITQNTDNLHQEAGSSDVIEVHGNMFRMKCLDCGRVRRFERKPVIRDVKQKLAELKEFTLEALASLAPRCVLCGSMMRPDVVMFTEPVQDMERAFAVADRSDVMLVLGTSGVVYPAAYLPQKAKNAGARVIVINPTENPFEEVSDLYIPMKTGEALPEIVRLIRETE
jgi:NAD-dependent deacetylase